MVDFVLSIALASRFPSGVEPSWGLVVGPSGVGKSEAALTLRGLGDLVKSCDAFTDHALLSGLVKDDGKEHSFITQLDRKLLLVEDFANVATMRKEECGAFQSMLRSAYKGEVSKSFGTGYKCFAARFGFLGCTVPTIDRFLIAFQLLGQRFFLFRLFIPHSQRKRVIAQALRMHPTKDIWRAELRAFVAEALLPLIEKLPTDPAEIIRPLAPGFETRIIAAADLVSRGRTLPSHINFHATNYPLENPPDAELGTRVGLQLHALGWARAILDGRDHWTDADVGFVLRVAWDSLPMISQRILATFYLTQDFASSLAQIARHLSYPLNKLRAVFLQYEELDLLRTRQRASTDYWALTAEARDDIEKTWVPESDWWPRISLTRRLEQWVA